MNMMARDVVHDVLPPILRDDAGFVDQKVAHLRSSDDRVDAIWRHDLSEVTNRLVEVKGYAASYAKKLEEQWKLYLTMLVLTNETFPMSAPVDEYAHQHILHTRNYLALCEKIGGFVHHDPTSSDAERDRLLPDYQGKTLATFRRMFGEPDLDLWPPFKCVCVYDYVQ